MVLRMRPVVRVPSVGHIVPLSMPRTHLVSLHSDSQPMAPRSAGVARARHSVVTARHSRSQPMVTARHIHSEPMVMAQPRELIPPRTQTAAAHVGAARPAGVALCALSCRASRGCRWNG